MLVIKEKGNPINYEATGEYLWQFGHKHTGPILILDLDGTVRDDTHRIHLLPSKETLEMFPDNPNSAYNKYQVAGKDDPPVIGIINLVKVLQQNPSLKTIVLSTSTASKRLGSGEFTVDQLSAWGIDYELLIMRSEYDQRHSIEQKIGALDLFGFTTQEKRTRIFALDDATHICKAFREYGITTLQVK